MAKPINPATFARDIQAAATAHPAIRREVITRCLVNTLRSIGYGVGADLAAEVLFRDLIGAAAAEAAQAVERGS